MDFLEKLRNRAKKDIKTIVLPESNDLRVLAAANDVVKTNSCKIVLVGIENEIKKLIKENNFSSLENVRIIDLKQNEYKEQLAKSLYNLRKEKGMTEDMAKNLMEDETYFSMMLLHEEIEGISGLVSGAVHSTAQTLRPALQIIKTSKESKLVSAFFVMDTKNPNLGSDGIFVFSDCGLNPDPNSEELAYIAIDSAKSFENIIGKTPKVAMLSYSSFGSANSNLTKKVIDATNIAKALDPNLILDGELQVDSAIVPEIAKMKAKTSKIQGDANVLIFPNLDAGNIAYKLVQRIGNSDAYGPLCQGLNKPVNDLSRGSTKIDIEGVILITAIQAQKSF